MKNKYNNITKFIIRYKAPQYAKIISLLNVGILMLLSIKYNIVYAIKQHKAIADVINNGNIHLTQQLLDWIQEGTLTKDQYRNINRIIKQHLEELNPDTTYRVNNLEIQNQNTGIPGNVEYTISRQILIGIGILVGFTLSFYIIYRYWEDLRNLLPYGTRITGALLQQTTLRNFRLVMHNDILVERIYESLITTIQDQ